MKQIATLNQEDAGFINFQDQQFVKCTQMTDIQYFPQNKSAILDDLF